MVEKISPEIRSRMMSGIRCRDTQPEMTVRSYLHRSGFRFRLHRRGLPGKPDVVLPRWNAVVFVHYRQPASWTPTPNELGSSAK